MSSKQQQAVETWAEKNPKHQGLHAKMLSLETFSIQVVDGPHRGEQFRLTQDRYHIGRASWCDLVLSKDMNVSRHHCELQHSEKGLRLQDRGSRNGLKLNDVPVLQAYWQPEQHLKVGDTTLCLHIHQGKTQIEVPYHDQSGRLVGESEQMQKIFSLLKRLGPHNVSLLLQGETGTGKTSIARALHAQSQRSEKAFIHVNCGVLSPSLIEAELFGYEKGAFTGAEKQHRGFFEQADGGTLFLDEIGELPLALQPKLLDVLERQTLRRLGGDKEISVDFRLISATHHDLKAAVQQKQFRQDLYYRLAVMELVVPPLRERIEDIPLLIDFMFVELSPHEKITRTAAATKKLQHYLWPGNVRQLYNVLKRSQMFIEHGQLTAEMVQLPQLQNTVTIPEPKPSFTHQAGSHPEHYSAEGQLLPLQDCLEATERSILSHVLQKHNWQTRAVREELQISKSWFYTLLKKHGLQRP